MSDQQPPGRIKDIRVFRDAFIGMGMLACVPFLIFGAIEVYGGWIATAMFFAWILILFLGTRWFTAHPRWVALLGLLGFAMWVGVVLLTR